MQVIVQQLTRQMFLGKTGGWTPSRKDARQFRTALEAIAFCIHNHAREIKLVGRSDVGADVYLYPFGGDPVARLELKRLRRSIKESRRLKTQRRVIQARIDILLAEGKEKKKQLPFKRQPVADRDDPETEPGKANKP